MRTILDAFDRHFISLDSRSCDFLARIPEERLFEKPREILNAMAMFSCGEYLLKIGRDGREDLRRNNHTSLGSSVRMDATGETRDQG